MASARNLRTHARDRSTGIDLRTPGPAKPVKQNRRSRPGTLVTDQTVDMGYSPRIIRRVQTGHTGDRPERRHG